MKKVSYERAKFLLSIDYSSIDGHLIWKNVTSFRVKVGNHAGTLSPKGYIRVGIDGTIYEAHRIVWLLHHGYIPENGIDHIDRISHHNHPDNLREVTQRCNLRNTGNQKSNTSGVKGVSWRGELKKWRSYINLNNETKSLGNYKDFDNAVCARFAAEQCLGWNYCDKNSPAYQYMEKYIL